VRYRAPSDFNFQDQHAVLAVFRRLSVALKLDHGNCGKEEEEEEVERMLCFVLTDSVLLNLLCVSEWSLSSN